MISSGLNRSWAYQKHVCQHEAAFRVRVQDLHRLADIELHDIAGTDRRARGHVLDASDKAHGIHVALRSASACMGPVTQAAPPMSPFMSSMPPAGLIEMPPVSKTTPLPTKQTGLAASIWLRATA